MEAQQQRGRRGRGGSSGGGRGATRGRPRGLARGRRSGVAGVGAQRLSVSNSLTTRSLESLEQVQPIETPLHQRRTRHLPASRPILDGYQPLWSSIDEIIVPEEVPAEAPAEAPAEEAPPSPSVYVECLMTVAAVESCHLVAGKRPANTVSAQETKRRLTSSVARSSHFVALSEDQIDFFVNFGSDDENMSDDGDDGEAAQQPVLVPRAERVFMPEENEAEEVLPTPDVNIRFDWPPPPSSFLRPEPGVEREPEPSAEIGPVNKFDFRWRGFSSQNFPEMRREPFCGLNSGPTIDVASPYEAFTAIWDRQIMEDIAVETNRYAQQLVTAMLPEGSLAPSSRISSWREIDADELYVFFAIILATGIIVKSRIDSYWSCDQSILLSPGFASVMSYNRFQLLSKCLHFSDNNNCNPNVMTRSEARLFKIRPIIAHLNHKFSGLYRLSQNIALDESLTQWKGWLDIKQFIRNKAASVGIKTYEVCESNTGYLWRFEVHAGHELPY